MFKLYLSLLLLVVGLEIGLGLYWIFDKVPTFYFLLVLGINILLVLEVFLEARELVKSIVRKLPKWLKKLLKIKC